MARCSLCGEENFTEEELEKLFDQMACRKCVEEYGEGEDHFSLKVIAGRRGKFWIFKNLLGL